MVRKHCARRWWRRGQHHSSTQVPAKSVASAISGPSFSLFSDSQSLFSRNPSNSHVENTTENVELEGGKGNNINASSVDETPYQSLPDTNSEPVIGGVPVTDKGKGKFVEDSELGGSRRESVPKIETQPVDVDYSDDSQLMKKKIGVAPKKCWDFLVPMDLDYKPKVDWDTNCHVIHQLKANLSKRLRFGLGEFALVTGLKFKGDTSIESISENRLISKYFGTASVILAQLADCFKKKKWETNDDALKIVVLYFANNFLLSQLKTKILLYECCPSLDGHFADHTGNKFPRNLNWVVMGQIPNERVTLRMSSLQREQLKNITPTDDEKQLFDVRGLNIEIEVECTDSQPDSFQVFGTQLPKTQSMHESTGGDSQPTNAEVMKELQSLKLFVETKFEEVLVAIGRQSMKSEGNSAHKQQDNDPDFREMHNDYDQFESGHVGNDPVVIGDSTPKAPSISGFGGVGQDGGATGVNVKNVTASDGVVNDDLRSAPFVNEHDFGLDSNFELSASAIDQITAITQQATYKQSSHDVKKSGPAPLPSGIPVQTRADVVIESNTAPQACRVDGVGQVDVGGSNVNLPSASCRHGGDLHLDSDFEYTDSQLDLIAAITQGGRRNVNQSGNELTTRAVNKSKPDQSVSRSIVQIQTDVESTPAVFTRRRRPAAVKQSPYRNDWQSGVSAVGGSSKVIKGRFPFVNDILAVVDYKLTTAFSNFVEANMQLGEEVYLPGDQKLDPCFDFEVEQIDDKMFFHTLNYSGRPLSSSHLNIIFYYLRKKAKYGINMPIKVTTTDTLFNNIIQRVFTEFVKGGKQDHLIDRSDDIMEYMKGLRMYCNTPWHQVDHVLFPINLAENWHWILGCVSFHKRCFYVYDLLRSRKHKKAIQKVAEAYVVLISLFLVSIEFYNQRSDIVEQNGLHMGKELTDPFEIEMITNLPTQQNSDCRVYVACFAEYIIEDLPIPVANFDVDGLRARFGILLWHYGRNKKLHGESSESEAPVAPKKTRGKKRKK
ncbi:PREDICTED: uncharacterized protein LOC109235352 [Nicotiana attenuata]|uniref:uncharacterized protein LOC109235352 n=1 Tax=Nicotiana attenuata TaxID=49451 RepID=UPI0009056861|nr:PREDICTED: uncharacterized protein LOC109235352 [Nicotiana attenuata]